MQTKLPEDKPSDMDQLAKGLSLVNTGLSAYSGLAGTPDAGVKNDVANPISNVAMNPQPTQSLLTNSTLKVPSRLGFNNAMMRRYMLG
jgi:hypothetical protein